MNPSHLHLLFNHFPIIGSILGFLVLAAGFFLKNQHVKNVAFGLFIFTAVVSLPAYFSGEGAEDKIEKLAGVEESYIEEHEEAALWGIIAVELLGIAGIIALFFSVKNKPFAHQAALATLALALFTMAVMYRVGNTGGEIRHPEIRKGATLPQSPGSDNAEGGHDEH